MEKRQETNRRRGALPKINKETQDSPFVEMLRSSTKLCEQWRRLLFPFPKLTQPNMQ